MSQVGNRRNKQLPRLTSQLFPLPPIGSSSTSSSRRFGPSSPAQTRRTCTSPVRPSFVGRADRQCCCLSDSTAKRVRKTLIAQGVDEAGIKAHKEELDERVGS